MRVCCVSAVVDIFADSVDIHPVSLTDHSADTRSVATGHINTYGSSTRKKKYGFRTGFLFLFIY